MAMAAMRKWLCPDVVLSDQLGHVPVSQDALTLCCCVLSHMPLERFERSDMIQEWQN